MSQAQAYIRDGERCIQVLDPQPYLIPASDNEPERNTYRSFMYGLAPSGAVQDLVQLIGAAGKVIRLKSVLVSGTATAATNIAFYNFKRSALGSGGTPTTVTPSAADSGDPAPSATLKHLAAGSANTPGAGVIFDGCRLNLSPAANGSIDRVLFSYTWQNDKAGVLRAATECFCFGLNGASLPAGGAIDLALTWSEE